MLGVEKQAETKQNPEKMFEGLNLNNSPLKVEQFASLVENLAEKDTRKLAFECNSFFTSELRDKNLDFIKTLESNVKLPIGVA